MRLGSITLWVTPWTQVDPAVSVMVDIHNTLINTAMMRFGTEEQKSRYLPLFASEVLDSTSLRCPPSLALTLIVSRGPWQLRVIRARGR